MKRWILVLSATGMLFPVKPAHAQKTDRVTARKYFQKGKMLFGQRKYKQAIEYFEKARGYADHPVIDFNVALANAFAGKTIAAARYLRKYLKKMPQAERNLPSILKRVKQQTGVLVVQFPDPTAEIYVDGRLVGRGGVEAILKPGQKKVAIKVKGKTVAAKTVVVPAGGEKTWELTRVPTPDRPRPPPPEPRVARVPGEVTPPPSPTPSVKKRSRSIRTLHWAYFTVAATLAVAALGTAAGLAAKTKQIHDDYLADRTKASLRDKGIKYERITNAMWGVGAGIGAAAAVLIFFTRWRSPEKPASVSLIPTLGPEQVGLSVQLRH